jgi:hypothetical protein
MRTKVVSEQAALERPVFRSQVICGEAQMRRAIQGLRRIAPYAAIELLMPGGSLLALLLWLYRRHCAAR